MTATLTDTDGSETLSQVDVQFMTWTGTIPTLNFNTGLAGNKTTITNGWRFTGTSTALETAQIQALLASMTVTPQAKQRL